MTYEQIRESASFIKAEITGFCAKTAVVLGSGFAQTEDIITDKTVIRYADIPHFPKKTTGSHRGRLVYGAVSGKPVVIMSGRAHYYQGYTMAEAAYYVAVLRELGIEKLIITNAAGGINESFSVGDFMLIKDHIKFFNESPATGCDIKEFGDYFFDMTRAYSPKLIELARKAALNTGLELREGVYSFMPGPQFETPAEIKMLRILGADAVGMSTVPEVIMAAKCGLSVLGISCISNMAAGVTGEPISDGEVTEATSKVAGAFIALLKEILEQIN